MIHFNYCDQTINLGEPEVEGTHFKMESNSSYLQKFIKRYNSSPNYRNKLLPLKLQCVSNIQRSLGPYTSYLEPFAGLGITAKLFAKAGVNIVVNEQSEECVKVLIRNFANVQYGPAEELDFKNPDVIFADFNNLTLKRLTGEHQQLVNKCFNSAVKYVILNDCSVYYLRYGESSYKTYSKAFNRPITNIQEYYEALIEHYKELYPKWNCSKIEAFKDTSFLLFTKSSVDQPELKINTLDDITIKTKLIYE
jgi:hypothetical protein